MFELIFIAMIHGKMQERHQDFSSMGQCQSVKASIQKELKSVHDVRIKELKCVVKKK